MIKQRLKSGLSKVRGLAREYKRVRDNVDSRLNKSVAHARVDEYSSIRKSSKLDDRTIMYESFMGRGITDNPYAFFKLLLADSRYKDYTHIWCIQDPVSCAQSMELYADYPNVHFVLRHSTEYFQALSSAKYLINNVTFPSYFIKREGQVYINTWHGTPLKSMGYQQTRGNTATANTERNFLQADYLLSANSIMTDMYLSSYKLKGILPGCIIEEGYPRNDLLLNTPRSEIIDKLRLYGIEVEDGKEIILYAPTWRDSTPAAALQNAEDYLSFRAELESHLGDQYQVLIKPHQFVYNVVKDYEQYDGLFVPSTIDSNEFMSLVDILISDYSSIFFDYMVLSRPIFFYITDADTYAESRGISFDLDSLPGPYTNNLDELVSYIKDLDASKASYAAQYEDLAATVCAHDDGNVTQRLIDYIFDGVGDLRVFRDNHEKKRLLISIGLMYENGVTHSFLSLLNSFDYSEWDVTAYVSRNVRDTEMARKINEDINPNVRVLTRTGPVDSNRRELIRREFIETQGLFSKFWKRLYPYDVLRNEFSRAFGNASFDYIVDFSGYGALLMPMLGTGEAIKKSVWLHNDILADMNRTVLGKKPNFTNLRFVVSSYPEYDHLVSCGRSVMEVNRSNLATDETYSRFRFAKNTIDLTRFKECAQENEVFSMNEREYYMTTNLDDLKACSPAFFFEMPQSENMNFVTMGRMSTEKNHLTLIEAFSRFVVTQPNARLYLIGGGPLEITIRERIKDLGLEEHVILTGRLQNPYAVMKRCDCFILPSLHEGQPLVLLEARACGLPIIVSNFSSVKDSLFPNGQLLIEPTEESIYEGLSAFARGEVPTFEFDVERYNREAYQEFIDAIM